MRKLGDALLDPTWRAALSDDLSAPYFQKLCADISTQANAGKTIFPPTDNIFTAFNLTPLDAVKVVILGQDPYHGRGQAMGLSFSVPDGVKIPPSLRNMLKEIETDIGKSVLTSGDLTSWARQGVLLLNSVLTVEEGNANAHAGLGWERFTDAAIGAVSTVNSGAVFMLWGGAAKKKASLIDARQHHILTAPHPSPLSSYRGFFGCRHFSAANAHLLAAGKTPINW